MYIKTYFLMSFIRYKTIFGMFLAGVGIFFYPVHKNYVGNLTSELARSTLTSPGTIRAKYNETADLREMDGNV
jgi:hypothetical protein